MAVAMSAMPLVAAVHAQQPMRPEPVAEPGSALPPAVLERQERRERRMRWLRATGQDEFAPSANPGLTIEERRQLRRDVHEAGRELYPDHKRRRRPDEAGLPESGPPQYLNQGGQR
jgi:hypothetical protein